jgi:hypothetical protein
LEGHTCVLQPTGLRHFAALPIGVFPERVSSGKSTGMCGDSRNQIDVLFFYGTISRIEMPT